MSSTNNVTSTNSVNYPLSSTTNVSSQTSSTNQTLGALGVPQSQYFLSSSDIPQVSLLSDDGRPYIDTTYVNTGVFSPAGNPVYVVKNQNQDVRNPIFVVNYDGGINVNFTDVAILPRSEAENYGVVLLDDEQLVEPNFAGVNLPALEPLAVNLNIQASNGKIFLSFPSETDLGRNIKFQTSTNLVEWSESLLEMTYDSTASKYKAEIDNSQKATFFRIKESSGVIIPNIVKARLQLIN